MKKQKFYNGSKIDSLDAEYNLLYGERSNGKSYWIKERVVRNAYNKGQKFIYLRRWQVETKAVDVESYFADTPITSITNAEYTCVTCFRGVIYLSSIKEDKIVRGLEVGRVIYLSGAEHFKSQSFPDYTDIIFEEVTTKSGYLQNEPSRLLDFVSTVARRNRIKVWLIGNTVSRICPYFSEWGLKNIPRQEQGTIDTYKFNTEQTDENGKPVTITIAVEYCENSGKNSKMFFGIKEKSIAGGSWETSAHPHFPENITADLIFEYLFKSEGFAYVVQLYVDSDKGGAFLYVYPYTKNRKLTRIISNDFTTNPFETPFLNPNNKAENVCLKCLRDNKICFSDNLTGDEFLQLIKEM